MKTLGLLALLPQLALANIIIRDEGANVGPVTTVDCRGQGITCSRVSGVGIFTVAATPTVTAAPITGNGSAGSPISCTTATGSTAGCVSAADWTTFNGKVPSTRSVLTGSGLTGGGDLSADRTLSCVAADATTAGCMSTLAQTIAGKKTLTGGLKITGGALEVTSGGGNISVPTNVRICLDGTTCSRGWYSQSGTAIDTDNNVNVAGALAAGTLGTTGSVTGGTGQTFLGSRVSTYAALWFASTPSSTNYAIGGNAAGSETDINVGAGGSIAYAFGNSVKFTMLNTGNLKFDGGGGNSYIAPTGLGLQIGDGSYNSVLNVGALRGTGAGLVRIQGWYSNIGSAYAAQFGNSFTPLTAAGAKIAGFFNDDFNTEKAYIDKDGIVWSATGVSIGSGATIVNSGGILSFPTGWTTAASAYLTGGAGLNLTGGGIITVGTGTGEQARFRSNIGNGAANSTTAAFDFQHVNGALDVGDLLLNVRRSDGVSVISANNEGVVAAPGGVSAGGPVLVPDGSSSAPGLAFSADPDTGFWRQQSGGAVFVANGVRQFRSNGDTLLYLANDGVQMILDTGGFTHSSGAIMRLDGAAAVRLLGGSSNGATAIGVKIANANTLTTAGAKIAAFYSDYLSTEKASVDKDGIFTGGGLVIGDPGTRPSCDSTQRGRVFVDQGGAGVSDTVAVCAKDAADAYAWRTIY